ncbi:MAG: hypothetical protein IJR01_06010 [Bacteroidales bacterium]|nr:hypothetical protein [Bacteroidales bacterium]
MTDIITATRTRYYIFLAAAVLLAGCHKEMEENVPTKMEGKTYLTVSTAQTAIDPESKTHMGNNGTSTHPVYWSNGDRITVNGMASDELSGLDEETQSVTFVFTDKILTPPYNILYPASAWADDTHIDLPATQAYKAGGFAEGVFPMSGYSTSGNSISLHSLCAILKIQILRAATDPDTDNLASVRFRGHNSEQVSGRFEIDYQHSTISGNSDLSGDLEVRVDQSLATSTENPAVYYLVVPAGDYSGGYEVTVVDESGHYMVKSKTSAKTLEAGHVYAMTEFEFVPTGTMLDLVINSAQELVDFASDYNSNVYSAYNPVNVTLGSDISFDATTSASFNATGGIKNFSGLFDGAGHSISGLQATVPLFVATTANGIVRNFSLNSNCSFSFTHANTAQGRFGTIVGAHAGTLESVSSAADITLTAVADVTQQTLVGGLVGRVTTGSIKDGHYGGLITVPDGFTANKLMIIGGVAGAITNTGSVSGSTFDGAISNAAQITSTSKTDSYTDIGGIVGYNSGGSITSCSATATHAAVAGTSGSGTIVHKSSIAYYSAVGGIVGDNISGTVSACTNSASVLVTVVRPNDTSTDSQSRYLKTGGIVGKNTATVTGCTNSGSVSHYSNPRLQSVGGVAGYNSGTLTQCSNTGAIRMGTTGVDPIYSARLPYMGGIIGENTSSNVSDVQNGGTIQLTRTEMGSNGFDICLGGVIGWNSGAIDGGGTKNITNSGTVLFNTNINQTSDNGYNLGGIAGYSSASVKNARNSGYVHFQWTNTSRVVQNAHLGGIVGWMAGNGEISGCENSGGTGDAGHVHLDITKAAIAHTKNYMGGILGYSTSNVTLSGCTNSGYVQGGNTTKQNSTSCFAGGIVAYLADGASSISNCTNSGNVYNQQFTNTATNTVAAYTGGIAGYVKALPIARIPISGCEVTTSTLNEARGYSGGIVGYAELVDIDHCNSSANASSSTAWYVGGIAGWLVDSSVSDCNMTGTTLNSGQMRIGGGLVAVLDAGSSLNNCTSSVNSIRAVLTTTDASGFVQGGAIAGSSKTGSYISDCTYPVSGTIEHGNSNGTTFDTWQICGDSNFTPGTPPVVAKTKVSIIGDSISTFEGYIVPGYRKYYPGAGVESVDQTYWYKFIYEYMPNAEFCKNLAWSGSLVHRITDASYSGTHWYAHYFYARAAADGFGDADVLIVNGGTNDYGYQGGTINPESSHSLAPGYQITGSSVPTDSEFAGWFAAADAATTASAVDALADDSFIQAYIKLLQLAKVTCRSGLKLILCIGDGVNGTVEQSIIKIADHYGAAVVDFYALNGNYKTPWDPSYNPIPKGSGVHPNAEGMAFMAEYMWTQTESYLTGD